MILQITFLQKRELKKQNKSKQGSILEQYKVKQPKAITSRTEIAKHQLFLAHD